MRPDIVPGAVFPDYELSDHTAKHRKLSELQGPASDGSGPEPRRFLPQGSPAGRRARPLHREIEVGYCRLVTISTDNITETNEYRSGVGAHWPFLSDPRRIVQKDLDIAEYTDPAHNPMIPHMIVLEPGLVIYKIYNGYWFFGRPTLEELRQDLRAVTRKCRPDWDITTPELKAAWEQGRKDSSILTERPTPRRSANRIRRRGAMARTHQPDEAAFRSILPEDIDWKPFPAFPPSARLAILVGHPSEPGPYVVRVKVPAGVKLMPHRHPEDRIYTVMSGVFYIGLGDRFDGDRGESLSAR